MTAIRKKVIVTDRMQRDYVYWRTEPVGRNFAADDAQQIRRWRAITRHVAASEALRTGRFRMPEAAATGGPALGVRQPNDLGRV